MAVTCPDCGRESTGFDARCPDCDGTLPLDSEPALDTEATAGAEEDLSGQHIGRFRIDGVLGRGGMGVVYRATDAQLERAVALKFISTAMAADPMARERFEREARAAARLDCQSVGAIYEIGQHQGRPWIAMAYYAGETLAQRLERGPLSFAESREIAMPLIEALDAAHRAGIVHRDVKPANIMLTSEGKVKLLDFGLAKLETAPAMTRTHQMLGTLAYMAPEQLQAEAVDARTDLWAVAVVWAEMLTGRHPFRGGQGLGVIPGILDEEPDLDGVPDLLRPILERCLSKKAVERPESMAALRSELAAAGLSDSPPSAPLPALAAAPPTTSPGAHERRFIGAWGGGLVAALLVALVLVVAGRRDSGSRAPAAELRRWRWRRRWQSYLLCANFFISHSMYDN